MLHKEGGWGGEKRKQKATLVIFYLEAYTSSTGFDKVTASISSKNLRSVYSRGDIADATKEGSSKDGEKQQQKEESEQKEEGKRG